jgi:hypothetical protein
MMGAGHVALTGEGRGVYRLLVGRLEGKKQLGRPRHRREDNIKMDHREIGIDGVSWIWLAPVAGFCEHDNEPSGSIKKSGFFFTS